MNVYREGRAPARPRTRRPSSLPPLGEAMPFEQLEGTLLNQLDLGDMGPVLAVETAIAQAVQHGCSDLYFEPRRECTLLRYRLDGMLHSIAALPKQHHERMVARIKVLAKLPVYQKALPQDGRIEADERWFDRHLRVATLPTIDGEKVVLRVIDTERAPFDLGSLGLRPEVNSGLSDLITRPQGTLLLTGPSSSGKTTTIYALLRELLGTQREMHVLTVEDPVEYRLDGVCQTQVNAEMGFDYRTALKAILRQDPDTIVIGEIRDNVTAKVAVHAGLTGHIVLSSIHSGTAAGVFTRLLDMDVEPYLVASSVTGVLAQRLIRKSCPNCLDAYVPPDSLRRRFGLDEDRIEYRKAIGCEACKGVGYSGRTAIAELLLVNDDISERVLARERTRSLHAAAVENGMTTILQNGLEKVRLGVTTLEELHLAVSPDEG